MRQLLLAMREASTLVIRPSTLPGRKMSLCNYTDYGGGDHHTAYQGCVWLFGCISKSVGEGLDCGL